MRQITDHDKGSRFSGQDIHAFVVTLFIAVIIIGLMVKIVFF